ncbi:hypothetical protein A3D03_03980 [Candidatus Gottesmanbacteria bacterium RIFCSPHIGHO2_02_FULL_40_13]|uniref:Uncharacterized protein n=1 Tax=Candidatus Gottesmanbacteria bacterium RIFCSPHIGHO2_02_FULL_40_13 TaxID=1798384 RepID=A0A1F6A801_9BACT|nr:MAG: hypothetical protein A3D03_03980 [Candidatus Gottesmanbacteria bacterium RIFCSPHIGHO2_02_FULL_40_13]
MIFKTPVQEPLNPHAKIPVATATLTVLRTDTVDAIMTLATSLAEGLGVRGILVGVVALRILQQAPGVPADMKIVLAEILVILAGTAAPVRTITAITIAVVPVKPSLLILPPQHLHLSAPLLVLSLLLLLPVVPLLILQLLTPIYQAGQI